MTEKIHSSPWWLRESAILQKRQRLFMTEPFDSARDFWKKRDRTVDQMVQAARSGKQNIIEGSQASGTSKELEIKARKRCPC